MAFTVTATQGGTGTSNGMYLLVKVLTSAAATQNGATKAVSGGSTPFLDQSITTTVTGSQVYGAITDGGGGGFTADARTTIDPAAGFVDTNLSTLGGFWATSLTGTPGATTLGSSATPAGAGNVWAAVEVLPNGTLTVDGSSPARATSATLAATTASFTPPAGSLLVAMACADGGTTLTMSDTSGLGLTWTATKFTNGTQAGVFLAQMPAATAASLPARSLRAGGQLRLCRQYMPKRRPLLITGAASQDDTVNAPVAASDSSTQPQPVASIAPIAGVPVATGTAPQATPAISALAGAPTATGTAPQPVISITDFAGIPAATGSAAAVANPAAIAGTATATGTAPASGISSQLLAGIPTATGTAPAPTVLTGTTVNAGIPTATGTAPSAIAQIGAKPGTPVATGTAPQPAASPSVNAGVPAATGAAAAVANIGAAAGMPAATATASQPAASIAVKPGIPAATGTAPAPGILTGLVVNAGIPVAAGTPPQPVAAGSVFAGIPAATGAAPATSHGVTAGIPAATGTAAQAKASATVFAIIPAASGTAPQATPVSVLPFTVGILTAATASGARTTTDTARATLTTATGSSALTTATTSSGGAASDTSTTAPAATLTAQTRP